MTISKLLVDGSVSTEDRLLELVSGSNTGIEAVNAVGNFSGATVALQTKVIIVEGEQSQLSSVLGVESNVEFNEVVQVGKGQSIWVLVTGITAATKIHIVSSTTASTKSSSKAFGSMELVALGSIAINNSDQATVNVVGTGTIELAPSVGYVPIPYGSAVNMVDLTNKLSILNGVLTLGDLSDGDYVMDLTAYFDCSHNNANNAHIGIAVSLERNSVVTFRDRQIHGKVPNNADISNLAGLGIVGSSNNLLQSGDILTVHIASDTTGEVEVHTSNISLRLYKLNK